MKKHRGLQRHIAPVTDLAPLQGDEPPFLRPSRRTRVRRTRRGGLGRVVLVLEATAGMLVGLFLLWAGYSKVMAHERLRVARVEVRGSRFLSEGEVRELLGPAVGENILSLDIDELKTRLRASPWVADATVARTLPDTLRVEIRERTPLALAEVERLYLMDGDGVLIDMYGPRTAAFDLPIVRGLGRVDPETRRDWARRAGALLHDLGDLAAEVSEVEVEPSGDMRVVLRGAGEVLRLGAPPYRDRFLAFLGLRKDLALRCPEAEYFDLRFRDRIYVKKPDREPAPAREGREAGAPAKAGSAGGTRDPSPPPGGDSRVVPGRDLTAREDAQPGLAAAARALHSDEGR